MDFSPTAYKANSKIRKIRKIKMLKLKRVKSIKYHMKKKYYSETVYVVVFMFKQEFRLI